MAIWMLLVALLFVFWITRRSGNRLKTLDSRLDLLINTLKSDTTEGHA